MAAAPFRVEWTLATPMVVPAFSIHLDDLVAWAAVDELERGGHGDPLGALERLPLAKYTTATDWVWQASRLVLEVASETSMVHWVRKTDVHALAVDQGTVYEAPRLTKISLGSGPLKAYSDFVQVQWIKRATAYGVGEIDQVRRLLSRVSHVGKWRRNGWGRVDSLQVVEDDAGLERWADRVLPLDAPADILPGRSYVPVTHPLRPPYWERHNGVMGKEPLEAGC